MTELVFALILAADPSAHQVITPDAVVRKDATPIVGGATSGVANSYRASVAALVVASVADAASSYGRVELNPILGRGNFGGRQVSLKAAIVGGSLAVQWLVIRKRPDTARAWKWVNWIAAGGTTLVAARNWRIR